MKLYIYEHCPYCVKARMIFGLKNIPIELEYLLNDEEDLLIRLNGVKQVPLWQQDNGEVMSESMNIVKAVDSLNNASVLTQENLILKKWLQDIKEPWRLLTLSHYPIFPFPEFATPESVRYYVEKKEKNLDDSLKSLRQKKNEFLNELNPQLEQLNDLILTPQAVNGALSVDDFELFPVLRSLTLFKDAKFPDKVTQYTRELSRLSRVPLLTDWAI